MLVDNNNPFRALIAKGNDERETFSSVAKAFEELQKSFEPFKFQYPLKDREYAQQFAKVMQIKAQQAHRFVPVIEQSQFVKPAHLGFIRQITVEGTPIQEHVLVDRASNSVIFIEEEGYFSALNQVKEEDDKWYFSGTYVYGQRPDQKETQEMFDKTFENMCRFLENENYEEIYGKLKRY